MGGMREIRGFTKIWEDEHPLHTLEAYYRASLEKVRRLFKSNKIFHMKFQNFAISSLQTTINNYQ